MEALIEKIDNHSPYHEYGSCDEDDDHGLFREKHHSRDTEDQESRRFLEYTLQGIVPGLSPLVDDGKKTSGPEGFGIVVIELAHHPDVPTMDEYPSLRTDIRKSGMPDQEYEYIIDNQ